MRLDTLFRLNKEDPLKSKYFTLIQFVNNNSIELIVSTAIKICRGVFIKNKFHKCENFFIASKDLKFLQKMVL